MEWLTNPQTWVALLTLTALEIVLGIDNIVFIYFAMGFSVFVEMLNLQLRARPAKPMCLRQPYAAGPGRSAAVRAGGEQAEPSG